MKQNFSSDDQTSILPRSCNSPAYILWEQRGPANQSAPFNTDTYQTGLTRATPHHFALNWLNENKKKQADMGLVHNRHLHEGYPSSHLLFSPLQPLKRGLLDMLKGDEAQANLCSF